jgi:hypothetical protein
MSAGVGVLDLELTKILRPSSVSNESFVSGHALTPAAASSPRTVLVSTVHFHPIIRVNALCVFSDISVSSNTCHVTNRPSAAIVLRVRGELVTQVRSDFAFTIVTEHSTVRVEQSFPLDLG